MRNGNSLCFQAGFIRTSRRVIMSLLDTVKLLEKQREALKTELASLDNAIAALSKVSGAPAKKAVKVRKRKKMSAEARRKISLAQQKRWKRVKQEKKGAKEKRPAAKTKVEAAA
jgi:hypothetical protein